MVAITRSAEDHDENTGESHEDLVQILGHALRHLEDAGQLPAFIERLSQTGFADVLEYDWLKPNESYVVVKNSEATLKLFVECRDRGFMLAANTVQNSGNVPLTDMEKALGSITVPDLARQFDEYINHNIVCGKDAE
jgi:hypothetical protein